MLVYCLMLALWLGREYCYRQFVVQLHHFITFVMAVAAAEKLSAFLMTLAENRSGQPAVLLIVLYTLFNVVRNASVRVLFLMVSWGYGFKYVLANDMLR